MKKILIIEKIHKSAINLLNNKKVFLSPHVATFAEECTQRMGIDTVKNIIDFFDGKLDKSMIVKF